MDDRPVRHDQEEIKFAVLEDDEWLARHVRLSELFSPAAPIDQRTLLAGRTDQLRDLIDVVYQRGQHAVLYGERGVGKTSLASVLREILQSFPHDTSLGPILAPRASCDPTDTFTSIWRRVIREIRMTRQMTGLCCKTEFATFDDTSPSYFSQPEITPNDVKDILLGLSTLSRPVIIVDEFDQVSDQTTTALFAATIKALSDQSVPATVVLVGAAYSVDELIPEQQSVERALVHIRLPRMSPEELGDILRMRSTAVGMAFDPNASSRITTLSQGLSQYTHSLGLYSAQAAAARRSLRVNTDDVAKAVSRAIDKAQESIVSAYTRAIHSTRHTLYPQVLLACALAKRDELGNFGTPDVREPLTRIMGRRYEIPAFAQHLNDFCAAERGPVLRKTGQPRTYRFRFTNPLLQPYVIIRAMTTGLVDASVLERVGRNAGAGQGMQSWGSGSGGG